MLLYRLKYRMPATDPRLLAASLEEIQLDLELDHHVRGEEPWECTPCGSWSYRPFCALCGRPPKAVSPIGKLLEREAAGEQIDWKEYERALYGNKVAQEPDGTGRRPDQS